MEAEAPSYNIESLRRMVETFGKSIEVATVSELSEREVIFVEDGNHGENRPRQDEFAATGIAFLRPPDLKDGRVDFQSCSRINDAGFKRVRKGIGRRGDIILTHRATVGRIAITDDDAPEVFVTNPGTTIWRSTDPNVLDQRFLYCFMRSAAFMDQLWSQVGNNSTFDYVSLTQQRGLRVAYPPIAEQKAIAAVLGALDDKIELNRRMNATLETMARALFQSWFMDFDPVRAKLDGRQPVGLNPGTAALFPEQLEDSPLGQIPKGWSPQSLPEAIEVNPRRALKSGTIAPYLEMKNLPTQGHAAEEVVDREFSSGTKFQNGDTLLARITPCLENGKTGYVDFLKYAQVGWGSTEYIVLAPRPPLPPQFGYLLARSDALRTHAIQNMTGTSGRQRVPSECFNTFWLAVPPPDIAERFDELTAPLMAKIKANADQSRILATLRDALLPKLLSGELSAVQSTTL
jgi:type I restriction enzyme S subunit